jgi:hypothetical protein
MQHALGLAVCSAVFVLVLPTLLAASSVASVAPLPKPEECGDCNRHNCKHHRSKSQVDEIGNGSGIIPSRDHSFLCVRERLPRRPLGRAPRRSLPAGCQSRSSASAPCRSCRGSRASRARRTGSIGGHPPGGASRQRRGRRRARSPAACGARGARGRTRASRTRRSRRRRGGVGRVGPLLDDLVGSVKNDCGMMSPNVNSGPGWTPHASSRPEPGVSLPRGRCPHGLVDNSAVPAHHHRRPTGGT